MSTVLVTGGSGFVGSHIILKLLNDGHEVRTTVRSLDREPEVRAMLRNGGQEPGSGLAFYEADLRAEGGWADAVRGCDYVLHVASPFPPGTPDDENELIAPARDGTLRVMRAARDAGVQRLVVTSSFAAIGYGHDHREKVFTEEDWTSIEGADVTPYVKSKTLAERAAWEFMEREGGALELAVVNPVGVFGPVLGSDYSSSIGIIKRLMSGMVAVPRIYFGIVDVRDLADLHVRAMQDDAAKGQRFLAIAGEVVSMFDVATMLRQHLGPAGKQVPRRQSPDWVLRLLALFRPDARALLPQVGIIRRASGEKARRLLGWRPRPCETTIADTADSLIRHAGCRPFPMPPRPTSS